MNSRKQNPGLVNRPSNNSAQVESKTHNENRRTEDSLLPSSPSPPLISEKKCLNEKNLLGRYVCMIMYKILETKKISNFYHCWILPLQYDIQPINERTPDIPAKEKIKKCGVWVRTNAPILTLLPRG